MEKTTVSDDTLSAALSSAFASVAAAREAVHVALAAAADAGRADLRLGLTAAATSLDRAASEVYSSRSAGGFLRPPR